MSGNCSGPTMSDHNIDHDTSVAVHLDVVVREPPMYRVVLLNDDFTPMEFVVELLMHFFRKTAEQATQIMLNIHHEGVGVCGTYPREIAETKVAQVHQHARTNGHPLKCRMEPS
ncbi:ATP-dependent Clp protease adaptor protein ClpS [Magnetococcus marinus MC-1]|uniref:ATP-dependent Clp protease adapter protein ClpS n=2 Tax=Magnetococcus TaxID=162171 RepID=A0L8H6_MAGMM|nr:ATP-dependent Clp protease adapter ClpS [Magnetococcus marinus]ABK44269.1 ATP-dependent Clp protease adaptor protein ClpS [Magnetococcus marinus MC-1]